MEKIIRALMVGFVLSVGALITLGYNASAEMNDMGKKIKAEVKAEMVEIRNRDMEYLNHRFNLVETVMTGKVINKMQIPNVEEK